MDTHDNQSIYLLVTIIILFGAICAAVGVFYTRPGEPYNVVNSYGDSVKIYGQGLYAHDSFFKAPIFRGTDFTILFLAVPLLLIALVLDMTKKTLKWRMFLLSVVAVFLYYSASIAFGVVYNFLHLLYIALFSACFFGFILIAKSIAVDEVAKSVHQMLPYKGIYVFLILVGISLIVAWLPDILGALFANKSLPLLHVYTTEITYILDMGIIAPSAWICFFLLKKRDGVGYILITILLTLCAVIGVMLPIQTYFQYSAGITLTPAEMITKNVTFCLLAVFAIYFEIRLIKAIQGEQ